MRRHDRVTSGSPSGWVIIAGLGLAVAALATADLSPAEFGSDRDGQPTASDAPGSNRGLNRLDSYLLDDPITAFEFGPTRTLDAQRAEATSGPDGTEAPLSTRSRFRVVS